jgi:hypothetical protein
MTWIDIVGIYAAFVATIVGIIEIMRYRREHSSKLNVLLFISNESVAFGPGSQQWKAFIKIKITNHASHDKFVTRPYFQLDKNVGKLDNLVTMIDIFDPVSFPVRLVPGEVFEMKLDALSFKSNLLVAQAKKSRAFAADTLGNKYSSKWINESDIVL